MLSWSDFSPFISECVWLMGNSRNSGQSYFGTIVGQGPAAWRFSAWAWDHSPGQTHWRLGRWGCMWFCFEGQLRRNCPGNRAGNLETVLRPWANKGEPVCFPEAFPICPTPTIPAWSSPVSAHTDGWGAVGPLLGDFPPESGREVSGRAAVSLAGVHHRFVLWTTGHQAPHCFQHCPHAWT